MLFQKTFKLMHGRVNDGTS